MVSYLYIVCTDLAALTEDHKLFSLAVKGFVFVVQLKFLAPVHFQVVFLLSSTFSFTLWEVWSLLKS